MVDRQSIRPLALRDKEEVNDGEHRGGDEQGHGAPNSFARQTKCMERCQGRVHHYDFLRSEPRQVSGPLDDHPFPLSGFDPSQTRIERSHDEKCAKDLVVRGRPREWSQHVQAGGPQQSRQQSCGSGARDPRSDQSRQRQVGEPGAQDPQTVRKHVKSEHRRENQEEETFAQKSDCALRLGIEQDAPDVARAMQVEPETKPGEIVVEEPGGQDSPENDQATSGAARKYAAARRTRGRHFGKRPTW